MSKSTDKIGILTLVERCFYHGVRHVVCSPGSRNAPLVITFDAHPSIETYVIHDERSAGFYALGLALALQEPVALCCTSGTALVNYFPAVAEAYYQCVPLIVISADRPAEWINQGDGQTIMQEHIFGSHVQRYLSVPGDLSSEFVEDLKGEIDQTFAPVHSKWLGPIHFNCPLEEPLYLTKEHEFSTETIHRLPQKEIALPNDLTATIREGLNRAHAILILVGQGQEDHRLLNVLKELNELPHVAILTENSANMAFGDFIQCIDRTLAVLPEGNLADYQPDLIISIGGAIVSKKIKNFLRKVPDLHNWRIGSSFPEMDTFRATCVSINHSPDVVLSYILNCIKERPSPSNFGNKWRQLNLIAKDLSPAYWEALPFCDLKIFHLVQEWIPINSNLHLANSSVVRYAQLFDAIEGVSYFSNRGTSGIDGSLSTACGVALATKNKLNVVLTGDVSFFYDSNALWSSYLDSNLRIILINNGGGGIFRIIEGPADTEQIGRFFEARHSYEAEGICSTFGVSYNKVSGIDALEGAIKELLYGIHTKPALLEINTSEVKNEQFLFDYFSFLSNIYQN